MNETIDNILTRRSIKKYKDIQVEDEKLELILKAGQYAANGRGLQSPIMIVVQNKEIREKLRKLNLKAMGKDENENMDPFYNAPTIVIVLADKAVPTYKEDGSLVIGNLMLAAHSIGIDSCWIHRAYEEFETEEGKEILRSVGIDEDKYVGIGHCILGYRDCEEPIVKSRKDNYIKFIK